MNKKGISPLISTLLLIFFAIALGLVVMSWGKTSQIQEQPASCEDLSLSLVSLPDMPDACYKDGNLRYTIENSGYASVDGLKVFILSDEIERVEQDKFIMPADMEIIDTSYSSQSQIIKLKITPWIRTNGEKEFCSKKGVEIENIGECR